MLCAHTVRRLKPGTFDDFAKAFSPPDDVVAPTGWVRFVMLRPRAGAVTDDDVVITFGFFDGTMEELNASQDDHGYADQVEAASQYVDYVVANGVYDVVVDRNAEVARA
jgi:hypothetical protein